jgi:phage baseplate assembly protein W
VANTAAIGLSLPIQRGNNGYFEQAFDVRTQVRSNLTNLILTRKGERPMLPEFGCNIHQVIFQPMDDDIQSEVRASVEEAASAWMPYITIDDVQVITNTEYNRLRVTIAYSILSNVRITDVITLSF